MRVFSAPYTRNRTGRPYNYVCLSVPYCQSTWMSVCLSACMFATLRLNISETISGTTGCYRESAQGSVCVILLFSYQFFYLYGEQR